MENLNIKTLSQSERTALLMALAEEEKAEKKRKAADRNTLKVLQDELCHKWLSPSQLLGEQQRSLVDGVFEDASMIITLKNNVYQTREKQDSHTFTARDGSGSITVGYNTVIGFDGTGNAGIQKVKAYLSSLSEKDDNYMKINKILNVLMKPDKNGNLNPARITELANLKAEIDHELFSDGIEIIINAQFKTRTTSYVRGWKRGILENGKEVKMKFSINAQ